MQTTRKPSPAPLKDLKESAKLLIEDELKSFAFAAQPRPSALG
jgi:hypothetical protein